VFELWDTGEGHIVIRTVAVDFSTEGDPLAAQARGIALTDYTSGYTGDGRGAPASRNVELWIAKP
jgi:hypothetical protein